jgi:hypothetical protein
VTDISQTGQGIAQNQQYVNTPALALSQTSATNLSMAQVSTKFGSNTVNYNARSTIAISTVSTPTWYYVFMEDPSYTGDTGSSTNLSVLATISQANLGVAGYTYMGAIQALPSGFSGAVVLPGGYPPPAANIIGS